MLRIVDQHRVAIFVGIVVLYLAGFNGQWRPEPDSALYLTIGRNLARGDGYTYHGHPHMLAYPGLPWLWAGVSSVFGGSPLLAANAVMLAIGLASLALVYRLVLLHEGDRATAVMVTLGVAISRMFFRYCFELRSDMPFLLGVLAFLVGHEAIFHARDRGGRWKWYDAALMAAGLAVAIVMRPTMWALLLAIALSSLVMIVRGNRRWGAVAIILLVALGAVLIKFDPRRSRGAGMDDYEQALVQPSGGWNGLARKALTVNLPGLLDPAAGEAVFGIDFGMRTGIPGLSLNVLPSLVVLVLGCWLLRFRVLWGLLFITTTAMMLAVLPLDRYFLSVLPLVVYAWWKFLVAIDHRITDRRLANSLVLALFLFAGGSNIPKIVDWIWTQHRRPFLAHYRDGKFDHAAEMGRLIHQNVPPDGMVVCPDRLGRIMTFYSDRKVAQIRDANLDGLAPDAPVFVLNNGHPEYAGLSTQMTVPHDPDPVATVGQWSLHRARRQP